MVEAGKGEIVINKRSLEDYMLRATSKMIVNQPFKLTETQGQYDVLVNVAGGGLSGQAEAIRHGITRALSMLDPENRAVLKKAGLVTRDSRTKRKPGQPGAERIQFSKMA